MRDAIRTGDKVAFTLPVWGGSYWSPKKIGEQQFTGTVERHSYGQKTGQHTFSVRLADGKLKLVKGRNLYGGLISHVPDKNSPDRAAEMKPRPRVVFQCYGCGNDFVGFYADQRRCRGCGDTAYPLGKRI